MNKEKQARLEEAGFRFGDAGDFLGLTDAERRLVDVRIAVSQLIRQLRKRGGLTQGQLADKINSSQSRVAKIEAGSVDVSLDLSLKAMFALGGELKDVVLAQASKKGDSADSKTRKARKVRTKPDADPRRKYRGKG